MFSRLKRWLGSKSHGGDFQKEVIEHWYCGAWYLYLGELRDNGLYHGTSMDPSEIVSPAMNRVAFNPWHTGHASHDTSGLIDGLIPAIRTGERVGLYEQVGNRYRTTSFYDGAGWDDGYNIDLRFIRSIEVKTMEE